MQDELGSQALLRWGKTPEKIIVHACDKYWGVTRYEPDLGKGTSPSVQDGQYLISKEVDVLNNWRVIIIEIGDYCGSMTVQTSTQIRICNLPVDGVRRVTKGKQGTYPSSRRLLVFLRLCSRRRWLKEDVKLRPLSQAGGVQRRFGRSNSKSTNGTG